MSKEVKHTPEPWFYGSYGELLIVGNYKGEPDSLCDSAYVRSIVSIYLGRRKMSINPWLIFWLAFAVMMLLGSYL